MSTQAGNRTAKRVRRRRLKRLTTGAHWSWRRFQLAWPKGRESSSLVAAMGAKEVEAKEGAEDATD